MTRWSKRSPSRCTEVESGARNVDNILTNTLLPEISEESCSAKSPKARNRDSIHVGIGEDGVFA